MSPRQPTPRITPRSLLFGAALALAFDSLAIAAASTHAAYGHTARSSSQVRELVGSDLDAEALLTSLRALGAAAGPELLDVCARALDPASNTIDTSRVEVCRQALFSLSADSGVELAASQVGGDSAHIRMALQLLEATADADAVALCFRLVDAGEALDGHILTDFESTLTSLHARDAAAAMAIRNALIEAHIPVQDRAVRALSTTAAPRTTAALAGLIDVDPILTLAATRALGEIWEQHPQLIDQGQLRLVRALLADQSARVIGESALALGRARDDSVVAQLIALLDGTDAQVKHNAHWALQNITTLEIAPRTELWMTWFSVAESWWESSSSTSMSELYSDHPFVVAASLRAIAEQRLHRDVLASSVADLLSECDAEIGLLACATLERLRSLVAAPALIQRLADSDPRLRDASLRTLIALSGRDFGSDQEAWRMHFGAQH